MQFQETRLPGVLKVTAKRINDDRGYFSETFRADLFCERVGAVTFVQHNQSLSKPKGTVRGLHFQRQPHAQAKLVRCLRGAILDVAVDLRQSSQTFGQHVAVELSAEGGEQLWIPAGFAHGFCTLEPETEVLYFVTSYYNAEHDGGVRWNDPALGIEWPVTVEDAILSPKDSRQPLLRDLGVVFT